MQVLVIVLAGRATFAHLSLLERPLAIVLFLGCIHAARHLEVFGRTLIAFVARRQVLPPADTVLQFIRWMPLMAACRASSSLCT